MSKLHLKWKFYAGGDISVTPAISMTPFIFQSRMETSMQLKPLMGYLFGRRTCRSSLALFNVNSTVSRSTPTIAGDLLIVGLFGPAVVIAAKRSNRNLMLSTGLDDHARGGSTRWLRWRGAATDERRIYTNIANSQHKNFTLKPSKTTTIAGGWVAWMLETAMSSGPPHM
ncbi:hypothetical protein LWI29_008173 [Acer saccharum]|uniref:Uncharacterized protein n=1 Tax=Acer saccharum TaxID=4024 RepID=A0AA39S382_ACESA|nr:hypothetical protein LWI29_008173 [Acer saccharum]